MACITVRRCLESHSRAGVCACVSAGRSFVFVNLFIAVILEGFSNGQDLEKDIPGLHRWVRVHWHSRL
jgi:hypothetical protein